MGYPPRSVIATAPTPASSGTALKVEEHSFDRFPAPPFVALVWPANTIPDVGVNAEEPTVLTIDEDDFTVSRGSPAIAIEEGHHISVLRTIDVYDVDEVLPLSYTDPDGQAGSVTFQVRRPQGTLYQVSDVSGPPFEGTVGLDEEGLWHWRALADGDDPGPEHTVFVRFSEVM